MKHTSQFKPSGHAYAHSYTYHHMCMNVHVRKILYSHMRSVHSTLYLVCTFPLTSHSKISMIVQGVNNWRLGRCEVLAQVYFSNSFYEFMSWALPVSHVGAIERNQDWFRQWLHKASQQAFDCTIDCQDHRRLMALLDQNQLKSIVSFAKSKCEQYSSLPFVFLMHFRLCCM